MKNSRINYLMQCALGMCEPEGLTEEERKYLDEMTESIRRTKEMLGPDAGKVTFSIPWDMGDDDDDGLF